MQDHRTPVDQKASGRRVRVDVGPGALVVAAALLLYLALRYFPGVLATRGGEPAWGLAVAAVAGLALTVLAHEAAHLVVARRFGVTGTRITLELRGGRAELAGEAPTPRADALIALAGPVANIAIAALMLALGRLPGFAAPPLGVLAGFLGLLNVALAAANLLPVLPLDGGRVLRAFLWARSGSLAVGTRLAWRWTRYGLGAMLLGGAVAMALGRYQLAAAAVAGTLYLGWRGRALWPSRDSNASRWSDVEAQ